MKQASLSSKLDKAIHGKLNDAMADNKLDYTKLSTFKMLFYSFFPKTKKWEEKL